MATPMPATPFTDPAPVERLERVAAALTTKNSPSKSSMTPPPHVGEAGFKATARGGRFSAHGAPSGGFAQIKLDEAERREITVRGIEHVQFAPSDAKRLTERAMQQSVGKGGRPGKAVRPAGQPGPQALHHQQAWSPMVTRRCRSTRVLRGLSTRRQRGSKRSRDRAADAVGAGHCAEDLVAAGGRSVARRIAHATGSRRLGCRSRHRAAASTSAVALLPGAGLRRTIATCRRRSWGSRHRRKDFSGDQVCLRDRLSAWRQGQVPGVGPIDRGYSSGSC
jgi:hypothetical protein